MPSAAHPIDAASLGGVLRRSMTLASADDPVLRLVARPVATGAFTSRELGRALTAMWRVLDRIEVGVGLAAPQVGLNAAIFLVDDGIRRRTIINPRRALMLPSQDQTRDSEGCLSVPGLSALVTRPATMILTAREAEFRRGAWQVGAEHRIDAVGFTARIFGHEMDHLDGRLFLDRADPSTVVSSGGAGSAILR